MSLAVGQQVVAMMGGMGRQYDGGYAEYTVVPVRQVIPVATGLDWATFGAVPEMLQTAHGSLTVGLDAQPGETLLVRGGTSSIGQAATILAKQRGMTVVATTRSAARAGVLEAIGVDHVVVDDGVIAPKVRALFPDGVDRALEPGWRPHPARHRRHPACARGGVHDRDAVEHLDPAGLLPDRRPAARGVDRRLRRRRDRPAGRGAAGLPRRRRGRPGAGADRARVRLRRDRAGAPRPRGRLPPRQSSW
ncbi:hypothetical protein [Nocardioides convexus]|uniref:hypothetical protein n=1 Tax=Nocardioides convexus TaxID=2712224 RepID=UPI002418A45E|nr:hypothetical protein [Nocardioides convexus]